MILYINTKKQPPTVSESLNAKTDADGVLQVYSSSFGSAVSSFRFKRGSTVPLECVFADAALAESVAKLRFGLKLAGRFDDLLVVAAETDAKTLNADGTVSFALKLTFDAAAIDAALNVNASAADDLATAAFTAEIEWENADGELTSTETVPATVFNNVLRGAVASSGTAGGAWTALMVIRMSWAEFSALETRNPDAIYFVPDAPSEVEEHDADPDAHAERFAALETQIGAVEQLARDAVAVPASDAAAGVVKLSVAAALTSADAPVGADESGALRVPLGGYSSPGAFLLSYEPQLDAATGGPVGADLLGSLRVPVMNAERLGVARTGGNGVFLDSSNRLTLALRDTAPGLAFGAARKLGVALRDQSTRPTAGNVAPVLADSAGNLCVPDASASQPGAVYLPADETSALANAAASLPVVRAKSNALAVLCGATDASDNCNQYSFVGPLSALGVTGAAADINSVTFYRRANDTPNGDTQVYLRLLKKTVGADGNAAWQIASQSVNAVAFSAQPINGGKCGTFYMRRVAGVEPPTCAETVALVMVGAADAEVNTSLQFGCKVAPSATGGVCVSIPIGDAITSDKGGLAVVPLVDVTWTPCAPAVGAASYDAPGIVQLSLAATLIDDPLGIGKQADGRIVCDMAQVRAVVNAAVAGVAAALEARVAALEAANG